MASSPSSSGDFPVADARLDSDGPRTVVRISGEHDAGNSAILRSAIDQAISIDGRDVVLDLADLEFMDASTVGAIVFARERLHTDQRRLTVRGAPRCARLVLHVCVEGQLIEDDEG